MIKGIGIDICKISRVKLELHKRILNEREREIFDQFDDEFRKQEYLASRFSVKEAILKALTGVKENVFMRDIVILNDRLGKPYVLRPSFEDIKIWISISHEIDYCVCQAIVETV